jgi:ubiquinone/menaquinone biosynthesis C-methylase UbiE
MIMETVLSHDQARRVYDRIGRLQDTQAFYEDAATRVLLERGRFESATRVFEFGCGTGRFAVQLLDKFLPSSASYRGVDISPKMISIAQARLRPYGPRAQVALTDDAPLSSEETGRYDRLVANYVLGLLSDENIKSVLADMHRVLRPDGLVCLADLSQGTTLLSRMVASAWARIQARAPSLVGGCRPIDLPTFLSPPDWQIEHAASVVAWCIPTEALVARSRQAAG